MKPIKMAELHLDASVEGSWLYICWLAVWLNSYTEFSDAVTLTSAAASVLTAWPYKQW